MPKIVDYEIKKREIIEKAVNVFVRYGYHTTNLSGIARECGMGRTTLYQYFRNKEEIFLGVIQYVFEVLENDCKKILERPGLTFLEKIKAIVSTLAMHSRKERNKMLMVSELGLLLHRQGNTIDNVQDQFSSRMANKFKYLIQEGIKSRELKTVNPESMAYTLFALVKSMVFQSSMSPDLEVEDYLQNINLLIDGLKA